MTLEDLTFTLVFDEEMGGADDLTFTLAFGDGTGGTGGGVGTGGLTPLSQFGDLAVGVDWTAALQAAVDSSNVGIDFGTIDASIGNVVLPADKPLQFRGLPGHVIRPTSWNSVFTGTNTRGIDMQMLNFVGRDMLETNGGKGAHIVVRTDVAGGIAIGADSDNIFSIAGWGPDKIYPVGYNVVRFGIQYECLVLHTSSSSFEADLDAGLWELAEAAICLHTGGSGYLGGASGTFDYESLDKGGSGGIIHCTVTNGVVTRVQTTVAGSGYTPDAASTKAIMIGRGWPQVWIDLSSPTETIINSNKVRHGGTFTRLVFGEDGDFSFNDIKEMSAASFGLILRSPVRVRVRENTLDGGWGALGIANAAGIRQGGEIDHHTLDWRTTGNIVRNWHVGVGIATHSAPTRRWMISENIVSGCTPMQYEWKSGVLTDELPVPYSERGVAQGQFVDNIAICPVGTTGVAFNNRVGMPWRVDWIGGHIETEPGAEENTNSIGMLMAYTHGGKVDGVKIRGNFYYGIRSAGDIRALTILRPDIDGPRMGVFLGAVDRFRLEGGRVNATDTALYMNGISEPDISGTKLQVKGRRIQSIVPGVTDATHNAGYPPSASFPVWANGGGFGELSIRATIVSGVITEAHPVVTTGRPGDYFFEGGSGSFIAKVDGSNGVGTGAQIQVNVVLGVAQSPCVVINGGTGFLGGDSTASQTAHLTIGWGAKLQANTNSSGQITSYDVLAGGTEFSTEPFIATAGDIVPTFADTPVVTLSFAYGIVADNMFGGNIDQCIADGYSAGMRLNSMVKGTRVVRNTAISVLNSPSFDPITAVDGATPILLDNTEIQPGQFNTVVPTAGAILYRRPVTVINTHDADQTLTTITGGIHGSMLVVRVSGNAPSYFTLTINETGNIDLGGVGTISLDMLNESVTLSYDQVGAKWRIIASQVAGLMEPETRALLASMTVPADAARQTLIDNLIITLKDARLWTKLDVLYVIAAHDAQAGRLNWKAPGSFALTAVNSPVFTVDRGYEGDGASTTLTTGWNPITQGIKHTLNSAVLGVWAHKASTINSTYHLFNGNGSIARSSVGTSTGIRVYDATGLSVGTGTTTGHIAGRRTTSTQRSGWLNGVSAASDAQVSTALGAAMTFLSATSSGWSDSRLAAAYAGGGFSDADMLAFHNALNTYMLAVGGSPMTGEEAIRRANEARQLLANPLLLEAFDRVEKDAFEDALMPNDSTVRDYYLMKVRVVRGVLLELKHMVTEGESEVRSRPTAA